MTYLDELYKENPGQTWGPKLETKFYDLMKENNFVKGKAKNKAKDAREKTSGLVNLGLTTKDRIITDVGKALLDAEKKNDFSSDNIFELEKDSYIYILQFLKYQICDKKNDIKIKPFISLVYSLLKLDYLSRDEFTYLLPICKNIDDVKDMVTKLSEDRNLETIDDYIYSKMLKMDNYISAKNKLIETGKYSSELLCNIGMNRKSKTFDAPFAPIFELLENLIVNQSSLDLEKKIILMGRLKEKFSKINKNQISSWSNKFKLTKTTKINSEYVKKFYEIDICSPCEVTEFKNKIFRFWHISKWKSTLEDYYDLNKRYFSLTGLIQYDNERFKLSEIGKLYFGEIIDQLLEEEFIEKDKYMDYFLSLIDLEKISPILKITKENIAQTINDKYGLLMPASEIENFIKKQENDRFIELIDSKFDNSILIQILQYFISRNDTALATLITDDSDVPTMFEYIIGVIWYNISGRKGYIKDYLNLSLDGNLLPKRHAAGSHGDSCGADLIFKYDTRKSYNMHSCLLEATLSESTGQAHMEWESCSRHLENYKKESCNNNDYTVFIAGQLENRAIEMLRATIVIPFIDNNGNRISNKFVMLDVTDLKKIIEKNLKYSDIYPIFLNAINCDTKNQGMPWYTEYLKNRF